jgi:SAM-dependent methyltransferase
MQHLLLSGILACPTCRKLLSEGENGICCINTSCKSSKSPFPEVNGKPVLVDYDNSVIQYTHLKNTEASSLVKRTVDFSGIKRSIKWILNGSNPISTDNFNKLDEMMSKITNPVILIVGGGTVGAGCEKFIEKYRHAIVSFDVYNSSNVDFIADGHSIPLIDNSVDLVIIQAVLEHVFDPVCVTAECYRVIKPDGYIYAETPFLQHVHEGVYDFTRFTVLGQRILFKKFETISMGFVSGVGQSLLWSIEYFISGLFRTRKAGKAAKVLFFWIRWLEKIIPNEWNSDGACGCYFLGQKSMQTSEKKISEYLAQYDGAQK